MAQMEDIIYSSIPIGDYEEDEEEFKGKGKDSENKKGKDSENKKGKGKGEQEGQVSLEMYQRCEDLLFGAGNRMPKGKGKGNEVSAELLKKCEDILFGAGEQEHAAAEEDKGR